MYKTAILTTLLITEVLLGKPMPDLSKNVKVAKNIEIVCSHKNKENIFMDKYAIAPNGLIHAFKRKGETDYHVLFVSNIKGDGKVIMDNDLDGKVDAAYNSNMIKLCDYARSAI